MKFESTPQGSSQSKAETREKALVTPESVQALLCSQFKNPLDLFKYIKEASDGNHAHRINDPDPVKQALTHTLMCLRDIRQRYCHEILGSYMGKNLESITTSPDGNKPLSLKDVNDAYQLGAELMATCSAVYYGEATYINRDTGELVSEPLMFGRSKKSTG
jgi:hypothetical protein